MQLTYADCHYVLDTLKLYEICTKKQDTALGFSQQVILLISLFLYT